MSKKLSKKITEEEKQIIIKSYELGVSAKLIAEMLNKSASAVRSFYCRWYKFKDLPPAIKEKKGWIKGRMGLALKKLASDNNKLGAQKLASKLKEVMPNQPWFILFYLGTPLMTLLHVFCMHLAFVRSYRL